MRLSLSHDQFRRAVPALWLFAILNTIFRDLHEMAEASTIQDILAGQMNGAPVTDAALLVGGIGITLMLATMLLSRLASPRVTRWLNLAVVVLAAFGMTLAPPNDPDDYWFASVTTLAFASIFVLSLRVRASGLGRVQGGLVDG